MRITSLLLFMLVGCSSVKKANKHLDKAFNADSATVALRVRNVFPCIITATDTLVMVQDSTIYIDCPDTYFTAHDTITKLVTKTIHVPFNLPFKTVVITKKIEDSAKIKVMLNLSKIDKTNFDNLYKKFIAKVTWIKVLFGIICTLSLVIAALLFIKK